MRNGEWGSVKVTGIRGRVAAYWIDGELTRMAQDTKKDKSGGVITCDWREVESFTNEPANTYGEKVK